jgi:D-arginine dehydrogenase
VTLAPAHQRDALRAHVGRGQGIEPIPVAEVAAMVPALRPGYAVAAAIERDAFDIDVAALHAGFLRRSAQPAACWRCATAPGASRGHGRWQASRSRAAPSSPRRAGGRRRRLGRRGGAHRGTARSGCSRSGAPPSSSTLAPHDCGAWPLLGDAAHSWYVRPEARRKLMVSPGG